MAESIKIVQYIDMAIHYANYMVLYSNYTMLQSTIFQGALYSATYVTVATLAFVAICFFPDVWSRIANGPDKQIGPFHNEFLIKLALVFFSKLKVPRLLLLYHYIVNNGMQL